MRTNIDIDDELMAAVLAATGAATKKEAVRLGLEALLRRERQRSVRALRGTLTWEGDLDEMRTDAS